MEIHLVQLGQHQLCLAGLRYRRRTRVTCLQPPLAVPRPAATAAAPRWPPPPLPGPIRRALLRSAVDEFGQTVVMVTHDPHAASYADRILVLADGSIVHDGAALTTDGVLDLMKSIG